MPAMTTVVRRPLSSTTIVRASMTSTTRTMAAFAEGTSNETKRARAEKQRFMGGLRGCQRICDERKTGGRRPQCERTNDSGGTGREGKRQEWKGVGSR